MTAPARLAREPADLVREIIADHCDLPGPVELGDALRLGEDLGLDTLRRISVLIMIEMRLNVDLTDEPDAVQTVGELLALVAARLDRPDPLAAQLAPARAEIDSAAALVGSRLRAAVLADRSRDQVRVILEAATGGKVPETFELLADPKVTFAERHALALNLVGIVNRDYRRLSPGRRTR